MQFGTVKQTKSNNLNKLILTINSFSLQLATAVLVIYSTFAAIYYSKVNPIVGDYDYVDYLGGGRSLSDTNIDYQDPTEDASNSSDTKKTSISQPQSSSMWTSLFHGDWIPKLKSTSKTIFDVIDKISQ